MIELETAVFLQNQKTGSTFVEHFLKENSDEEIKFHRVHKAPGMLRKGKFHFTTVRDPLDLYLSLFNYGLDGAGHLWEAMKKRDKLHFYADGLNGFEAWLQYALSDALGSIFGEYAPHSAAMGLCSWRFLRLAQLRFNHDRIMIDHVLKFENLNEELKDLTRGPLARSVRNVDAACAWIDGKSQINRSTRRDQSQDVVIGHDTLALLRQREAYLYDTFYPQQGRRLSFRANRLMRWRKVKLSDLRR